MHTGGSLGYPQCKCMSCAGQRHQALEFQARIRYRDEFNAMQERIDLAQAALSRAQDDVRTAENERFRFIKKIREEIDAEQA